MLARHFNTLTTRQWSLKRLPLKSMLLAVAALFSVSAWSDCACFCVDGELSTMCTEVAEAQDRPNLCPTNGSASCPQEAAAGAGASYDAPTESATNCRDVRVYDAIRGEYVTTKACNVI